MHGLANTIITKFYSTYQCLQVYRGICKYIFIVKKGMYIYISKIDYTYDNTIQHTYVYVNKVKRKQCTRQLISYEIRFNKKHIRSCSKDLFAYLV